MANPFVHVELNTPDPVKAKSFYAELFDWQLEDVPNPAVPTGTYTMIKVGEGTGGGIMKNIPDGPSGWLAYVEVDDIRGATKKAAPFWGFGSPKGNEMHDIPSNLSTRNGILFSTLRAISSEPGLQKTWVVNKHRGGRVFAADGILRRNYRPVFSESGCQR